MEGEDRAAECPLSRTRPYRIGYVWLLDVRREVGSLGGVVIRWLDDLGKDWGRYMRRNPGWPYKSLSGVLVEYGSIGAAIRAHSQAIPINDMPVDVREWHNAWEASEPRTKYTLYVFYVYIGDAKDKGAALGVTKSTLYQRVSSAQTQIWSTMELQSRVRKFLEVRESV